MSTLFHSFSRLLKIQQYVIIFFFIRYARVAVKYEGETRGKGCGNPKAAEGAAAVRM